MPLYPNIIPDYIDPWPTLVRSREKEPVKMEPFLLSVGIRDNKVIIRFQASVKSLELDSDMAKAFAELVWRKAEEAGG